MTGPRFLCVALVRAAPRCAPARGPVVVGPAGQGPVCRVGDGGGTVFGWRLLGANNRELGRGPDHYPDRQSCREAITLLRDGRSGLEVVVRAEAATRSWAWQACRDGLVLAVSGRGYRRQRECRYAVQRFLETLPVAEAIVEVAFPPAWSRGDLAAGCRRNRACA